MSQLSLEDVMADPELFTRYANGNGNGNGGNGNGPLSRTVDFVETRQPDTPSKVGGIGVESKCVNYFRVNTAAAW